MTEERPSLRDMRMAAERAKAEREDTLKKAQEQRIISTNNIYREVVYPALQRFAQRLNDEEDIGGATVFPGRIEESPTQEFSLHWSAPGHRNMSPNFEIRARRFTAVSEIRIETNTSHGSVGGWTIKTDTPADDRLSEYLDREFERYWGEFVNRQFG